MSKLEMDVQNCTLIHGRFSTVSKEFGDRFAALAGEINGGLDSMWKGTSANEFLIEYNNIAREIKLELQEFNSLAAKLESSINDYKQVDEKFG